MSRSVRLICPVLLLVAATSCFQRPNEEADQLLTSLQSGDDDLICSLIHGCPKLTPEARKSLIQTMTPLRGHPAEHLEVAARRQEEHLQMVIVRIPWQTAQPFQPLLLTRKSGTLQIVGLVLPFDNIVPLLNEQEMREAVGLGVLWVQWMNSGGGQALRATGP